MEMERNGVGAAAETPMETAAAVGDTNAPAVEGAATSEPAVQRSAVHATASAEAKADVETHGETAYNFSRAGHIGKEQMRAVGTVNEQFARTLTNNLSAWLRSEFTVEPRAPEQQVHGEFVGRLDGPQVLWSLHLEPLGAVGVLQMDGAVAAPLVDLLLGGPGVAGELRELTTIEEAVLGAVVEIVLRELNRSWAKNGLQLTLDKSEPRANAMRLMPTTEKIVMSGFAVTIPNVAGRMSVVLPSAVLHTLLRHGTGEQERPRRRSVETRARLTQLLGETGFGAVLQFPTVRLAASEIADLSEGRILRLPLPKHAAAELRIGGLPFFRAHAVQHGEHRGARLTAAVERMDEALLTAARGRN
jgi:flagellar motor switch protein FliM